MTQIKQWIQTQWRRSVLHRALLVSPPVVLILLAGFWTLGGRSQVQYYTDKVGQGDIVQVVQATGTINAVTTVQVGSQVSGRIAELYVDFNSKVNKGDVIAKIEQDNFRARLTQAEADLENALANVKGIQAQIELQQADLAAAKAAVDRAQAQLREAEVNLRRTLDLFQQGIVAESQRDTVQVAYDSASASLRVAEAQYEQAKARVKQTQAQLDQAKAQVAQRRAVAQVARVDLSHTIIEAPIDGTVIARNVDVGQTVAASLQAPVLFVIAQDLTKMLVYAKTDEADVGKIKVGAMATFRVDSFPREMFRGRVRQVRMNATTVQNVVTYDTIIEFDNPEQKLFPGMTAYVTIPIAWANDVVKIPNGALRFHQQLPEDERKRLLAQYNIPEEEPAAGGRQRSLAAGQGRQGAPGGGTGTGGGPSSGAGGSEGDRAAMMRRFMMMGGGAREQTGIVYKMLPSKELMPVRVKLGVTDYTFTELKEGELKPGDEVVIGRSTGARNNPQTTASPFGGQQRGPMGMPGGGGLPRR